MVAQRRQVNALSLSVAAGLMIVMAMGSRSQTVSAFVVPSQISSNNNLNINDNYATMRTQLLMVSTSTNNNEKLEDEADNVLHSKEGEEEEEEKIMITETTGMPNLVAQLQAKMGSIEEDRFIYPDLQALYSSLKYERDEDGSVTSSHNEGSVIKAAALVAGSIIGAGVLALPTASAAAGFLPSSAALGIAWVYMTMSGLLIAETTMNRIATSGRTDWGLLELFQSSLGTNLGRVGSAAYLFLHYAVLVACISQGGYNLDGLLSSLPGLPESLTSIPGTGQALVALGVGGTLLASNTATIEKINSALVAGAVITFLGIVGAGSLSADLGALVNPDMQHPEQVVNCFPILFAALVFQNAVPKVVTSLEGNRIKITTSIIAGTGVPFLMFLAFNAVVLGNALNAGVDLTEAGVNPVVLLQRTIGGDAGIITYMVGGFSTFAILTSLIGFANGLVEGWSDIFKLSSEREMSEKWKLPLYSLVFLPPLAMAISGDSDTFYNALDCAGAFGVSTLLLVLPPWMAWKERYGDDKAPLVTKPLGMYCSVCDWLLALLFAVL